VHGHTGGIPDFTGAPGFGPAVGADPLNPPPPIELLSFVADDPLDPTAGSYSYSNSDNIIVGLMAGAARSSIYERELISRVITPLGLNRTYLYSAPSVAQPDLRGYDVGDGSGQPEDVTNAVDFGGWAWASGGIVSTPANLNRFIRSYIGDVARLDPGDFIAGGHSEPRGPGRNAAGLAVFRYETDCGTVYGHTGSILGYTQFMAATESGRRSVTFSINAQYSDNLLPALRKAEERAVCAALA
jgi:D-alanyl-D-alanine carboxypeptidase